MLTHLFLQSGIGLRKIGGALGDTLFQVTLSGSEMVLDDATFVDLFGDVLIQPFHGFRAYGERLHQADLFQLQAYGGHQHTIEIPRRVNGGEKEQAAPWLP